MGQSAEFVCDKCGFRAELNLRQPDCGFMGLFLDRYCSLRKEIVSVSLGQFSELPEEWTCSNCEKAKEKTCNGKCTEELVILEENPNNDTVTEYRCPVHDCGGIMKIDPNGIFMDWD